MIYINFSQLEICSILKEKYHYSYIYVIKSLFLGDGISH
jgi:hypothetical protein